MQTVRDTFDAAMASLAAAPGHLVLLAVALWGLSIVLAALRWRSIMRALGHELGFASALWGLLCSVFVNNVTPTSRVGGEVFRIAWLKQRQKLDVAQATAGVAIDRAIDLVPVGVVALVALPSLGAGLQRFEPPGYLVLGGALLVALAVGFVVARKWQAIRQRLLELWRHLAVPRPGRFLHLCLGLGFGALSWVTDLVRLITVAHAFGVSLSLSQAATLVVMTLFGALVPTFGGVGAVEGGLVAAMVWFGLPTDTAIAIALLERSVSFVLATGIGGLTVLALGGKKLTRLARPRTGPASGPSSDPAPADS